MKIKKEKVLLLALLLSSGIIYGPVEMPLEDGFDLDGTPDDGDMNNSYDRMSRKPVDTTPLDPNRLKQLEEELRKQDDTDSSTTFLPARTQVTVKSGPTDPTITTANSVDVSDLMVALDDNYSTGDSVVSENIESTPGYSDLITSKQALKDVLAEPVFKNFPNNPELIERFTAIKKEMNFLLDAINGEMKSGNTGTEKLIRYTNQLNALQERCRALAQDAQKEQNKQVRIDQINTQVKIFFKKPLVVLMMQKPSLWSFGKDPYKIERSELQKFKRQIDNSAFQLKNNTIILKQYDDQIKNYFEEINRIMAQVEAARRTQAENFMKSKNGLGMFNDAVKTQYSDQINNYVDGNITLKKFKALIKPPKQSVLSRLFGVSGTTKSTKSVTSESPSRENASKGPQISAPMDGRVVAQAPEVFGSAARTELNKLLKETGVSQEFLNQKNQLTKEAGDVKNQEGLKAFIEKIDALSGKKKQVPVIDSASIAVINSVAKVPFDTLSEEERYNFYKEAIKEFRQKYGLTTDYIESKITLEDLKKEWEKVVNLNKQMIQGFIDKLNALKVDLHELDHTFSNSSFDPTITANYEMLTAKAQADPRFYKLYMEAFDDIDKQIEKLSESISEKISFIVKDKAKTLFEQANPPFAKKSYFYTELRKFYLGDQLETLDNFKKLQDQINQFSS